MGSSAGSVNLGNFVTVKPCLEGDERSSFKIWKEQMLCLLESQGMLGFIDGGIIQPPDGDELKLWRRTDRLVKGWILGSIGRDALNLVWEKETAKDVWLELHNIFTHHQKETEKDSSSGRYLRLYQAAQRGEWELAESFFTDIKELSTTIISSKSETALHVAVSTGKANDFVKKLVASTPCEALVSKDSNGDTALHVAAEVGNTEAAMALVDKNPDLLYALNDHDRLPVQRAAINCQKKTVKYLISKYDPNKENNPFQGQLGIRLLVGTIVSEFVDVALDLARKYPDLALLENNGNSALSTIAEMHTLFPRTEYFTWWERLIYHVRKKVESMMWNVIEHLVPKVKELRNKKIRREGALELAECLCEKLVSSPGNEASTIFARSIINAAKNGNSEIVEMIIRRYPEVALEVTDETGMNVFMLGAHNRFENVINLIYNMSDRKYMVFDCTDNQNNNLMHTCGKLGPPNRLNLVPGAALQMQRELQWFKEMENFVHPSRRLWPNNDNETPRMLFTNQHEKLKGDGERWMKDTANACTIAAALIATVMFAAVFTVPGGIDSVGDPLFSHRPAFDLFAVSDAISLFTSITSLLMFLSILTSRYAEEDFLYLLPKRLSIGLLSLFVSITFMMVAFSAAFYLVFRREGGAWFLLLMAAIACFPVTSFVLLQFPLLVDLIYSTYGPGIFGNKTGRLLY
ncbi:hypothetical protein C2S53_015688 [Perilla frutescens var. hirtella]|uniref:PGG domain-containing protein n=1 Tax=Perilla frutescens var. hirtella TaxID=608512 RepID=A0AAD4J5R7_PERFH|nr:hypothetical protein C2S53_015688 [Perilla frutescens var. hirtella]